MLKNLWVQQSRSNIALWILISGSYELWPFMSFNISLRLNISKSLVLCLCKMNKTIWGFINPSLDKIHKQWNGTPFNWFEIEFLNCLGHPPSVFFSLLHPDGSDCFLLWDGTYLMFFFLWENAKLMLKVVNNSYGCCWGWIELCFWYANALVLTSSLLFLSFLYAYCIWRVRWQKW